MRFLSTIFHLKPVQVFWRISIYFRRKTLQYLSVREIPTIGILKLHFSHTSRISKSYKLFGKTIKFNKIVWNIDGKQRLWNYHIQYFDFLKNCGKPTGLFLINNWIDSNPPNTKSNAWEPYPISLRVVNWIKFLSKHQVKPNEQIIKSLQLQKKWLFNQRELHLLGNHFFKNIVALFYLSVFLNDTKLIKWSVKNLDQQLKEQFTNDGMHFEFSPTYHALIVQDLLDVYNLIKHTSLQNIIILEQNIVSTINKSITWLNHLSIEGKYLPIGDVNYQDCPTSIELEREMANLDLKFHQNNTISKLFPTIKNMNITVMLTNAPFSPMYNAAHSHADKNGLLIWYQEKPLFIDTGNFDYENSLDRQYARSVKAHNCINIDDIGQANLWGTFRTGDRGIVITGEVNKDKIESGFKYKNYQHNRIVWKTANGFNIIDDLNIRGSHHYKMYWHVAPEQQFSIKDNIITFQSGVKITFSEGKITVTDTKCYPSMYSKQANKTIVLQGNFTNFIQLTTEIWI